MRIAILAIFTALLLTACAPITPPAVSPQLSTPTPDAAVVFRARYAEFRAAFEALNAAIQVSAYDDPDWRADTVEQAQQLRTAVEAIQDLDAPQGEGWAEAWPLIQEAMGEFHYAAGAAENAARDGNQALLLPTPARLANGANLLNEAFRLMGEE